MPYSQMAAMGQPGYNDYFRDMVLAAQEANRRAEWIGDHFVPNAQGTVTVVPAVPEAGLQEPVFSPGDVAGPAASLAKIGAKAVARAVGDDVVAMIERGAAKSLDELVDFGSPRAVNAVGVTDFGGVGRKGQFPEWFFGPREQMSPEDMKWYRDFLMPLMDRYPKNKAGEAAYRANVDELLDMDGWRNDYRNPISYYMVHTGARSNVYDPVLRRYVSQVDMPEMGKQFNRAMKGEDGRVRARTAKVQGALDDMFDYQYNAGEHMDGLDVLNKLYNWGENPSSAPKWIPMSLEDAIRVALDYDFIPGRYDGPLR